MTGRMKIAKELYDQPYWKSMQIALFETFDIYCFDGNTLEVVCSGPNVPDGDFTIVITDLAKINDKTDMMATYYDSNGNEFKNAIIRI